MAVKPSSGRSALKGILHNLCPRCGNGRVFRGIYQMNPKCSECGVVFEREDGYFLGSLVLAYFMTGGMVVPVFSWLLLGAGWELPDALALCTALIVLSNPVLFYVTRMLWVHLDRGIIGARGFDDADLK